MRQQDNVGLRRDMVDQSEMIDQSQIKLPAEPGHDVQQQARPGLVV
jgi:hypothetical protein